MGRTCSAVGEEREAGAGGDGGIGVAADAMQSALQAGRSLGSWPRAVDLVGLPVLGYDETWSIERGSSQWCCIQSAGMSCAQSQVAGLKVDADEDGQLPIVETSSSHTFAPHNIRAGSRSQGKRAAHQVAEVAEGLQLARHEHGVRQLDAPRVAVRVRRLRHVVLGADHDARRRHESLPERVDRRVGDLPTGHTTFRALGRMPALLSNAVTT